MIASLGVYDEWGEAYLLLELDIVLNQYSTLEFEFAGTEASECDDSQIIAEHRQ